MRFVIDGAPIETGGPEDRLLPWNRVRDMTGISRTTAWRMQQTGEFPAPVPVSSGRVGWWESELTAWKGARGRARPLKAPVRPRFAGMPRQSTKPEEPPARDPLAKMLVAPASVEFAKPVRKRSSRAVSPGQIDFGF